MWLLQSAASSTSTNVSAFGGRQALSGESETSANSWHGTEDGGRKTYVRTTSITTYVSRDPNPLFQLSLACLEDH